MHDFVERGKVIETLRNTPLHITGIHVGKTILAQYSEGCRSSLADAVKQLPSAEEIEQVRHGYWINCGKTKAGSLIFECSCCHRVRSGAGKSKYCRDCGAKMDIKIPKIPKLKVNW